MEDISVIINIQGFVLPSKKIPREFSWVHLNLPCGETFQVFTPDYRLDPQEKSIVNKCYRAVHGLKFKKYANGKNLWLSYKDVKEYIKLLHSFYGGTFAFKGGVMEKEILHELNIPSVDLEEFTIQKCPRVLGEGCSMHKCLCYKTSILNSRTSN